MMRATPDGPRCMVPNPLGGEPCMIASRDRGHPGRAHLDRFGKRWVDDPTHWVGDAPTSLHGNGASSFEHTTRDAANVTCGLCRTLLDRESHDSGSAE